MIKLSSYGNLIFKDRYSHKDTSPTRLTVGKEVVVLVNANTEQRELGTIVDFNSDTVTVKLSTGRVDNYDPVLIDVPTESLSDAMRRMARTIAAVDKDKWNSESWQILEECYYNVLSSGKFVPAGRMWAGLGIEENLTAYNCYVLPPPKDSLKGIIDTQLKMIEIMSRGGGVGIPLMTLRPKHELARRVNGRSSGSVAWAETYSTHTNLVEQAGSRRGALMLIQYIWHPDIIEFITAKKEEVKYSKYNPNRVTDVVKRLRYSNISVAITDDFMRAVENDDKWELIFPDCTHPKYDEEWDGDIKKWKSKDYPVKVYHTIKAKELFNLIVSSAHASAEPGLFFVDRYNEMSNSWYYAHIWCTNPCGEQGIPGWAVCNLGHLNLSKFVIYDEESNSTDVDWSELSNAVHLAVRFMDNVIDIAYCPHPENTHQQTNERRIGLGTLGLAELLIKLKFKYGSDESINFINKLYKFIAYHAYSEGIKLAKVRGSFKWFDAEKYLESGFMKGMPEDLRDSIRVNGIRNVTYLTQAPTGTVGTMLGTSTGIEPFYEFEWMRTGRLGDHKEVASVMEGMDLSKPLPDYFVTASTITPEEHVKVQAAIQRWTDSSISKTCNLPENYTVEDVGNFYKLLYRLGCKGGTVYRDNSRSEQVLHKMDTLSNSVSTEVPQKSNRTILPVPDRTLDGKDRPVRTPLGTLRVRLVTYDGKDPHEVWLTVSKAGTSVVATTEALARLMSFALRLEGPMPRIERLEFMMDQMRGLAGGDPVRDGAVVVRSLPDGIVKGLEKILDDKPFTGDLTSFSAKSDVTKVIHDECPSCHQPTLLRIEGCLKCSNCAYSKC
jgi:ribonucleoside-diphosphate reductase alpha chain